MDNQSQFLFLLGGQDLEMVEIRKMLDHHHYVYADKGLGWSNAKWEEYSEYFDDRRTLVGIELSGKDQKPEGAIDIDHHNERNGEPASIEQVAKLIGVQLDRWQQLVAANDRGFIPAMEQMGATKDEISRVRKADRQAQGVTEKDEKLAELSIEKHLREDRGITIIESLTPKFSPLTDRMYGRAERLLVYNDETMNYYGPGSQKLSVLFTYLVKTGKAYSGGGESGFFGLVRGFWNREVIQKHIIPEILKTCGNE